MNGDLDIRRCPLCGALDPECRDACGCYAKNPEAWRKAMETLRQAAGETDPPRRSQSKRRDRN